MVNKRIANVKSRKYFSIKSQRNSTSLLCWKLKPLKSKLFKPFSLTENLEYDPSKPSNKSYIITEEILSFRKVKYSMK